MVLKLWHILMGALFISALTYCINLGVSAFIHNPWWCGFISAMFFGFMSNVFNTLNTVTPVSRNPGVTDIVAGLDEGPREGLDDPTRYLDSRAAIDRARQGHGGSSDSA